MSWKIIIISGGEMGAERAALDFAIRNKLPHGGWCVKGRQATDGALDAQYKLKEAVTDNLLEPVQFNVRDADATVVITLAAKPAGAAQKPLQFARKLKKPFLHLHRGILGAAEKLIVFLDKHAVKRLHVASARETEEPGVYAWTNDLLEKAIREVEIREGGF